MAVQFSQEALEEIRAVRDRYPTRQAAVMPVLWLAQREFGWLSEEAQQLVADTLEIPVAWVSGVATFYTMYYKKPVGRHHLQVCTNLSCMLRGSDAILETLERECGTRCGGTSEDGLFTVDEVECLGSCGTAPMLQCNDDYHENLDVEKTRALVERLRGAGGEG